MSESPIKAMGSFVSGSRLCFTSVVLGTSEMAGVSPYEEDRGRATTGREILSREVEGEELGEEKVKVWL